MTKTCLWKIAVVAPVAVMMLGCENLPGSRKEQGAVIGGAAGAATGAVVAKEHRVLGAILGGALGAAGGYVIAARTEGSDTESAKRAATEAEQSPATAQQARQATTADINADGFVTLDEVVAMQQAGFSDQEMIRRMKATDQIFELTQDQQDYLRQQGVSDTVITEMSQINAEERDRILRERGDVIGRQPSDL